MHIKEFADFTGVSVRTLHYYDEIGLVKPAVVDANTGYRFYDEGSLERMQAVLYYRELGFSLKSIHRILSEPGFDREKALEEQKALLILKKKRLERMIEALNGHQKGESLMKALDNTEFETARRQYEAEVKEKWGKTDAYHEYAERTRGASGEKQQEQARGMEAILEEFALCMRSGAQPDSAGAQALVKKLQDHITGNYYTCTRQILAGLGQMYTGDERFRKNIDKHAPGTAEYMSKAIAIYCQ